MMMKAILFKAIFILLLLAPLSAQAITCTKYLRSSDGSDGDDGSTWALAYATLDYALSQVSAGNTICMDDDHSESFSATKAFTTVGTYANPVKVIVVTTDTTTPVSSPPASANLSSTTSGDFFTFNGGIYFYGIYINPYDGLFAATDATLIWFENSKIENSTFSDNNACIRGGSFDAVLIKFVDTDLDGVCFRLERGVKLEWIGGSYITSGTDYDYLISMSAEGGRALIEGVDLSAWGGSTALVDTSNAPVSAAQSVSIINSKLPSSFTYFSGSTTNPVNDADIFSKGSNNTDGYWDKAVWSVAGEVTVDTSIYRSGGATYDGSNGFSTKMVTNGNALEATVCIREKITSYGGVDATSSANAAVHITYDSASAWDNSDFFIEVKYPDATDEALGKWVSTAPSPINDTPSTSSFTDVSGTETWNGTSGFSNAREETVDVDFTGALGTIEIWVNFCKPSSTIYVDMLPDIS